MNSEIGHVILIALNGFLRQPCLVSNSVISSLEATFNGMCYINSHFTYLLCSPHCNNCELGHHLLVKFHYTEWSKKSGTPVLILR